MVIVMVLMGVVSSLAMPGVQRMYDSMNRQLVRNELHAAINSLALLVSEAGRAVVIQGYPADAAILPVKFTERLNAIEVSFSLAEPLYISALGFCPVGAELLVAQGETQYSVFLRSPDCRVIDPPRE